MKIQNIITLALIIGITQYSSAQTSVENQNFNYIILSTLLKEGVLKNEVNDLPVKDVIQQIQYLDGLGRLVQEVTRGGSPQMNDIINGLDYDNYGRVNIKYSSYASNNSIGIYRMNYVLEQANFYQIADKVAHDNNPVTKKIYEPSPLTRVLEQGAPGEAWQPGGATVTFSYEVNENDDNVRIWEVDNTSGDLRYVGNYEEGQLYKNVIKDEQDHQIIKFTDKLDRIILKRLQVHENGESEEWANTYYVYDDFGNLRYVLPPEANKAIGNPSSLPHKPATALLDSWAFQYKYDHRKRIEEKRVPGADWVIMIYDNRDRLVLTQDGEQRLEDKFTFTKYDALNRPIMTGEKVITNSIANLRDLLNGEDWLQNYAAYETLDGDKFGYTSNSLPKNLSLDEILTVTYYDNYNFKSLPTFGVDFDYDGSQAQLESQTTPQGTFTFPSSEFASVKGQVTGTMVRVLNTSSWIKTANYYDEKYRLIQTYTENDYQTSATRTSNLYNFPGWLLATYKEQTYKGQTRGIKNKYVYDHAGRLLKTWHKVDDAETDVLLSENEYNELGQVVDKKLHSVDNGFTFKQSVDYRYNIQGWLTSINNSALTNDGGITNEETDDLFGMNLAYNDEIGGLNNVPQFNGNISAIQWNKGVSLGGVKEQAYNFAYDPMNRLTAATHKEKNLVWSSSGAYHEDGLQYDLNGNIKRLNRTGKQGASMDQLVYHYQGNQLLKVDDASDETTGFTDGGNPDDDYVYDGSGNMTVDKNKGITSILYNHLNLPEKVTNENGDYIKYIYDATGRKLSQQVYNLNHELKKKSDYVGEYFYQNDTLKFISHEEGRVVMTGEESEYQYHLKDHLGNVRLTFTTLTETASDKATLEDDYASTEQGKFLRYENARKVFSHLVDRTNDSVPSTTGGYAQRLSGGENERYGLAKTLSVQPGDKINIEVYAKYIDTNNNNWSTALTDLMAQIAAGPNGSSAVVDGGSYSTSTSSFIFPLEAFENTAYSTEPGPKAYLNWLIFDRNYNFIPSKSGYDRLSADPRENGQNIGHERLFSPEIIIDEPGYIYIYLSNEDSTPVEVFFDDFKVEHVESPVVQRDDYYPFGLTFNSYSRENSVDQKYLYNGKELQDELSLSIFDYGARSYDPVTGRWWQVDPLSEQMRRWSPYNFSFNNPLRFLDSDGMAPDDWVKNTLSGKYEWKNDVKSAEDVKGTYTYVGPNDSDIIKDIYGSSLFRTSDWDVGQVGVENFENPYSGKGAAYFNATTETTLSVTVTANVTTELNEDFSIKSKEFNGVNIFASVSGEVSAPYPGVEMKLNKLKMQMNGTEMEKFSSRSPSLMVSGDVPTQAFQGFVGAGTFRDNHINTKGADGMQSSGQAGNLNFKFKGIYLNGNHPMKLPGPAGLSGISNYTNLSLSINRR